MVSSVSNQQNIFLELSFLTSAFLTHLFFGGVLFPALYLLFKLKPVHFKLFAHCLVLLFYALNYLCGIFDSSAGEDHSLKKTSNSNSKQTKMTKWGERICPLGTLYVTVLLWKTETALGHLARRLCSAGWGRSLRPAGLWPPLAHHSCCRLKHKGCCGGFSLCFLLPHCPTHLFPTGQMAWPVTLS